MGEDFVYSTGVCSIVVSKGQARKGGMFDILMHPSLLCSQPFYRALQGWQILSKLPGFASCSVLICMIDCKGFEIASFGPIAKTRFPLLTRDSLLRPPILTLLTVLNLPPAS
jgi:hypothetical protein